MIGNKIPRSSSKRNVGALTKVLNSKRVTNSFPETGKTKGQGAIISSTITLNLWVSLWINLDFQTIENRVIAQSQVRRGQAQPNKDSVALSLANRTIPLKRERTQQRPLATWITQKPLRLLAEVARSLSFRSPLFQITQIQSQNLEAASLIPIRWTSLWWKSNRNIPRKVASNQLPLFNSKY